MKEDNGKVSESDHKSRERERASKKRRHENKT